MLSQTGSKTSSNLHRTKSTTSVRDRRKHPIQPEPVDRQTARTDALIAAHRAFDRSRASTSTELSHSESVASRKSVNVPPHGASTFSPASHLRRQRSTLQTRVPRLADTLRVPESLRPESRSHTQFNHNVEFGVQGETYGAEPSSYRRLKHSRSLLTPTRQIRQQCTQTSGNSLSGVSCPKIIGSPGTLDTIGFKIRLKRSLNFLRPPHQEVGRVITAPAQLQSQNAGQPGLDASIQSQTFQKVQTPAKKKSTFLMSVRSRQRLKISPEVTQIVNVHQHELPTSNSDLQHTLSPNKTRPVSASIGGKFKRLFGKSHRPSGVPPQQLTASKAHFSVDLSTSDPEAGFDNYLGSCSQSSRRSSLYIPQTPDLEPRDDLVQFHKTLKRPGSCSSLSSKSKSRVTSWTNSTDTASLALQSASYDPKRLSVIREDGAPYQPSSSAGRHIGGVAVFQRPLNIPQGCTVDSQRVYSALLKRIDDEQKEMEKTKDALKEIHDAENQNEIVGHYLFSTPTIRRVESRDGSSLTDLPLKNSNIRGMTPFKHEPVPPTEPNHTSVQHEPVPPTEPNHTSVQHENRPTQARCEVTQLRFLPHSAVSKTSDQGCLQKVIEERGLKHDGHAANGLVNETNSSLLRPCDMKPYLDNDRFAQSTESIYSRTTNGGTNVDYVSPLASSENFGKVTSDEIGITRLLHSSPADLLAAKLSLSDTGQQHAGMGPDKTAWRGWMESQLQDLQKTPSFSRATRHFREHAQIVPDDTGLGVDHTAYPVQQAIRIPQQKMSDENKTMIESLQASFRNLMSPNPSSTSLRLQEVPRNSTPAPTTTIATKRSQSTLAQQPNLTKAHVYHRRESSDVPTRSQTYNTAVLKSHKSQPVFLPSFASTKENVPIRINHCSPVSTPGKDSIRSMKSARNGQLRKAQSGMNLGRDRSLDNVTARHAILTESPSIGPKNTLAARLSKPFDMSVPDRNRPFDSTYLGKREVGNGSRLSVAPAIPSPSQRPKTYGDLGRLPFSASQESLRRKSKDTVPTALPAYDIATVSLRSVSGSSLGVAGKRLVSNFLKSRRRQKVNEIQLSPGTDPAFI